jgi:intracellular sulfur oxidation DsrE/DsrF family protein
LSTRRDFIAASSLLAVAPAAVAASPVPTPSPGADSDELSYAFDRVRFDAILNTPARHKQCFGATKLEGGDVLDGMHNSNEAYANYYPHEPYQAVAVLYHGSSVALAMNDAVWNDILTPWLPHNPKMAAQIPEAKAGSGNPYLRQTLLPAETARGSFFFVCHNAIAGFSYSAADALGQPVAKVHAAIMAGIIPGALVVPAGVMAINACQEAHFTYIQSSV